MKKELLKGFTLIELLIVIAIIAILAAVIFVALNPLKRFKDARDAQRWSNVNELSLALKLYQVDNNGFNPDSVGAMVTGTVYMIGTDAVACNAYNSTCSVSVTNAGSCVNLTDLANANYIKSVPISPSGRETWTSGHTGYAMMKSASGFITITACESEGNSDNVISVAR